MKVLDLRCSNGHVFEGWFGSEDDFMSQNGRGLIACPICDDHVVTRMLSAPRLNLSGARAPKEEASGAVPAPGVSAPATTAADTAPAVEATTTTTALQSAGMQAMWLRAVRELMAKTEDVGPRFAEEARRIHYGEVEQRGIRGQATPQERAALQEEGIETVSVPVPSALKGPVQ